MVAKFTVYPFLGWLDSGAQVSPRKVEALSIPVFLGVGFSCRTELCIHLHSYQGVQLMLNLMDRLKLASSTCCKDGMLEMPKVFFPDWWVLLISSSKVFFEDMFEMAWPAILNEDQMSDLNTHIRCLAHFTMLHCHVSVTNIKKYPFSFNHNVVSLGTIHVLFLCLHKNNEGKIAIVMVVVLKGYEVAIKQPRQLLSWTVREVSCLHSINFREIGHKITQPFHKNDAISCISNHFFLSETEYSINHIKWFSP